MVVELGLSKARVCRCDKGGGVARDEMARETITFAWSDAIDKMADNPSTVKVGDVICYIKAYGRSRELSAGCATDHQAIATSWHRPRVVADE